jgi:hypothetical protein
MFRPSRPGIVVAATPAVEQPATTEMGPPMTTWLSSTAPHHPEHASPLPLPTDDAAAGGEPMDRDDQWNFAVRGETPTQRLDRAYGEILQEVRVAQTGGQLLLAFLLTLAFTPRFTVISDYQRDLYVASLVLGAASNALLIAPAPFHRLVYKRRLKRQLVRASSRFALFGVTLLMFALTSSLLLILDVVVGTDQAQWIAGGTLGWFGLWWYVAPMWSRLRDRRYRRKMEMSLGGAHRRAPR